MMNLCFWGREQAQQSGSIVMNNAYTKVLLIEDNPGDIRLIREMLEKESKFPFELVCSNILSKGLKRAQRGDIHVILLDLSLPDSDGLESLSTVLAHAPGVPIIVLTGTEDGYIVENAVEKGARGYLVKGSIDSDSLAGAIRDVV